MSLSRRKFLRGVGGVALAIPTLELMHDSRAGAAGLTIPKRFVNSYAGVSTGRSENGESTTRDSMTPSVVGPGYDLPRSLKAVDDLGLRDDISVVSGLLVPWEKNGVIPPGGRPVQLHYKGVQPLIAGTQGDKTPATPTCDQVVADVLGTDTPHRNLVLRVQASDYLSASAGNAGRISWAPKKGGGTVAVDPIVSPRLAFETLFKGLAVPSGDTGEADYLLKRRKSVIDLVQDSRQQLLSKLGTRDRERMERHFDELRALEVRLEELEAGNVGSGVCAPPSDPGDDPPIGKLTDVGCTFDSKSASYYDQTTGYSNEELRGELLSDFVAMAFACDLTRVVSYQLSFWKCYMNAYAATGYKSDFHSLSHQHIFPHEAFADGVGFHVKLFAQLVSKLGKLKEIDGSNLLDHCALSLVFEGGRGLDPQTGTQHSTHSSENMVMLVAGRAGGLRAGHHIVAKNAHPAQVVAATMHAVGVKQDLGEVSGIVPELLGA
ncbi:MAG: DUF1552 domain-containing protein [Polyangiaceae bacterium]